MLVEGEYVNRILHFVVVLGLPCNFFLFCLFLFLGNDFIFSSSAIVVKSFC